MRRPLSHSRIFLAIVVALGLSACSATIPPKSSLGEDQTGATPSARSTQAPASGISWHACHKTYQCATLRVPLDWSNRSGEQITLALIRKPAQDPHPIGSILLNPGGPGEPGVPFLQQLLEANTVPKELQKRFDLVSWDPRGTGDSSGIACSTAAELESPDPLPYPPTVLARAKVKAKGMSIQRRCLRKFGAEIPHVGTIQTVHDLEAIRVALGDAKLNYVGFSYGTAIGLEYLRLFGTHVRAMVLDGIDLPGQDPVEMTHAQMASFEANLNRFLDKCKQDPTCAFGHGDPQGALATFLARLQTGVRIPASYQLPDDSGTMHERRGTLGYSEAVTGIAAALYSEQTWDTLRSALAAASASTNPDGHVLLALRDMLGGRQLDGTWNHSDDAQSAISCADQKERSTNYFGDPARIASWAKELPVFGAFGAVGLPGCYQWPKALEPLGSLSRAEFGNIPQVVLVNSAHDPATPYANALKARTILPQSELVTWGGNDHTSFAGGHRCIDNAVVPYLVSLAMPGPDVQCKSDGT